MLKHSRLGRLMCWIWYGHTWDRTNSRHMMARSMNTCIHCDTTLPGPD